MEACQSDGPVGRVAQNKDLLDGWTVQWGNTAEVGRGDCHAAATPTAVVADPDSA
jgi:hypothetical protein